VTVAVILTACGTDGQTTGPPEDTRAEDTVITPDTPTAFPDGTDIATSTDKALVMPNSWVAVAPGDDPFADTTHRINCPEAAYGEPNGYFEVETDKCNYLTVRQAALLPVTANQTIKIVLWHLPLGNTGVAEAKVGIRLGTKTIWEETITLPSPAKVYQESVVLNETVSEGDPVYFHVRNHGNNSWRLLSIELN